MANTPPTLVLLSGGLDSATCLAIARRDADASGAEAHAISFDYNQRHRCELDAARAVADAHGADRHITVPVDLRAFGGSALTDDSIAVPKHDPGDELPEGVPATYVPARNLVFLSLATAYAETINAARILIGVNAIDYSGYPDCRPEFVKAFNAAANLATRQGTEGAPLSIDTPLIDKTKAEIIALGTELGVDYSTTVSCYDPDGEGRACGACDACILRARGFADAGVPDPTRYQPGVTPPTPAHA